MCCRFQLVAPSEALTEHFGLQFDEAPARKNIKPAQPITIVRIHPAIFGKRQVALTLWGFIPSFAKLPDPTRAMFNARAEGIWEKPSFRHASARRRCLIPATGFYEWEHYGQSRIPWQFGVKGEQVFSLGGIWEQWNGASGEEIETCAIITVAPNETMRRVHNRMPLIIHPDNYEKWLNCEHCFADELAALMTPYPSEQMTATPLESGLPDDFPTARDLFTPEDLL